MFDKPYKVLTSPINFFYKFTCLLFLNGYICHEMFQRLTTWFLLVALIGSSYSRFFVYAGFEINQKYIIDNLCINRYKPAENCNGRCYLEKNLKQAGENEKKQSTENKKGNYQEALPEQFLIFRNTFSTFVRISYPTTFPEKEVKRPRSIFQPPKLV
ncbi:hypothetical protein ACVWYG_001439 [Pedobacter sp. UYEF25]